MQLFARAAQGSVRALFGACVIIVMSVGAFTGTAHACSDSEKELYRSSKSVWCVEQSIIDKYGEFPSDFFKYGDSIVDELAFLFNVPPDGVYTFEAGVESGGAHTGSECCGLGVTVTGDAFYNDYYDGAGAKGFWGYLLSLHELINDWTGQVSGGWPTDFWADHVSAFPNSIDWHVMATMGEKNNNAFLSKAAMIQKGRFYPGGDSADARVVMFDKIYDLPTFGGYDGYSRVFSFIEGDKLNWDSLGVNNPDVKRTEYVMAYLSLGAEQSVTPIMNEAHVGDGSPSGAGDDGYNVSQSNIDAIATAHCAIAAAAAQGGNVDSDREALRSGNYAGVQAKGKCGDGCPSECACNPSNNLCVAPWLGTPISNGDGDTGSNGDGDTGSTGDGDHGSNGDGDHGSTGDGDKSSGDGDTSGGDGDTHGVDPGNGNNNGNKGSSGCTLSAPHDADEWPLALLGTALLGLVLTGARKRRR